MAEIENLFQQRRNALLTEYWAYVRMSSTYRAQRHAWVDAQENARVADLLASRKRAEAELAAGRQQAEAELAAERQRAEAELAAVRERVRELAAKPAQTSQHCAPGAPVWSRSAETARFAQSVRFGHFKFFDCELPAVAPGISSHQAVFHDAAGKATAAQIGQWIALRVLASSPAGSVQLRLLDFSGLGTGFGLLGSPDLVGRAGKPRIESADRLADLRGLTERAVQLNTEVLVADDDSYWTRLERGEMHEPGQIIFALGLPGTCTSEEAELFRRLVESGQRAGITFVCVVDSVGLAASRLMNANLFEQTFQIFCVDGKVTCDGLEFPISQDRPIAQHDIDGLGWINEVVQQRTSVRHQLAPNLPPTPFSRSANSTIEGFVGQTESGAAVSIQIGDADGVAVGGVIVGPAGSGKTTLLHTLLHSACYDQSPDELNVFLLDMKEGVEFNEYTGKLGAGLPHVRLVGIESDSFFAHGVLRSVAAENTRRAELFKAAANDFGKSVQNLDAYRAVSGDRLPRLLLVIDEFQRVFEGPTSNDVWDLLEQIARQGRSQGIHLLLATQAIQGVGTDHRQQRISIFNQLQLRIAFRTSPEESEALLGARNATAASLPVRRGAALLNTQAGNKDATVYFQVAFADENDRRQIRQRAAMASGPAPRAMVSLGGSNPTARDVQALAFVGQPGELLPVGTRPSPWDPIAGVEFKRDRAQNLLVASVSDIVYRFGEAVIATSLSSAFRSVGLHLGKSSPPFASAFPQISLGDLEAPALSGDASLIHVTGIADATDAERTALARLAETAPRDGTHLIVYTDRADNLRQVLGRDLLSAMSHRLALGVSRDRADDILQTRPPYETPHKYAWLYNASTSRLELIDPITAP